MVSLTAWVASFLMIVPIVMYAGTSAPSRLKDDVLGFANATFNDTDVMTTPWTNQSFVASAAAATTSELPPSSIVSCNINWPKHEYLDEHAAFTLYTFTLTFVIPLVFISVFYFLVLLKLRVYSLLYILFHY